MISNFLNDDEIIMKKPLNIVQVAPDYYPLPPTNYGGMERIIYNLTEHLVLKGHNVYLYAPKGSKTSATLIPYEHSGPDQQKLSEFVMKTLPENVDIIHDHTHSSVIGQIAYAIPTVCTIHCIRKNDVKSPIYLSKRALDITGEDHGYYVYNGIDPEEYEYCEKKEDYLLYMGVLNWYKGILQAIDVAERTRQKLIIAGPIHDFEYFRNTLEPRINNSNIQYVGEVGGLRKQELLKKARCLLFPTICEEPFGLVMIEALACGTPVLALANGGVEEVLAGFPEMICHSTQEMCKKVLNPNFLSPKLLRDYVSQHFTTEIMTDNYLMLYKKVLKEDVNLNHGNKLKNQGCFKEAISYYKNLLISAVLSVNSKLKICHELADIYSNLGDTDDELAITFKTFEYDTPHAEFCCRLGYHFLNNNELQDAIFWYKLATQLEKPQHRYEILSEACWTWLPNIQLCICYYKLGDPLKAFKYNEAARNFLPNDKKILFNKTFLEKILNK
ncbi:glycosyltransferase [Clostridium sp. JS66]|uniref:glycosyltransferase n=1 Tax=Clostridium sp. JS66 TaxID=3064705 RepID=UPI00298E90DF|nr:glycosyltransferase [Clostridium sp. JS66]WPC42490.1 glycosyltransferase [Clostridium sp. JS66]